MGLAQVQISVADFHTIHGHIVAHMPNHRNMHMREARQRKRRRNLRHLHAMYAPVSSNVIEGMISGPGVFWQYRLILAGAVTQIQVLVQVSSPADDQRLGGRFLRDVLARVASEQALAQAIAAGAKRYSPRYIAGQFYLRRALPGMLATHQSCQAAVSSGVLAQTFVSQLHAWNFELLHP